MSKIRVLSDHVANQIAAGEVVERPASVAKELVENSIDAGARRVEVDVEAGGRRLLRVSDDGCGMTRDDAVLAFERHATSKITSVEDLERISTLGFRGEALASIASVARVELITQQEGDAEGTRVLIEGGRMRDVAPAARPVGTTISVRELFFNVPARRKFLRSEATESFHLANLVTHYALAHPEISFALTNNGREVLRASAAESLRERAYQIFGAEFLENLLEVEGVPGVAARVRGYISAPRERRTTRDAQYLFVNGRYVRDRLVARALSEGYRSVLPQGAFPAALLFLEVEPEEVDVNVHPAKTEVRFRRTSAVAESVREAVRAALASAGFLRADESAGAPFGAEGFDDAEPGSTDSVDDNAAPPYSFANTADDAGTQGLKATLSTDLGARAQEPSVSGARQETIEFGWTPPPDESPLRRESTSDDARPSAEALGAIARNASLAPPVRAAKVDESVASRASVPSSPPAEPAKLPPLDSAAGLVREAAADSLSQDIRPLGQLEDSFIVATDSEGLLLIDQHAAHERILFDKYRRLEDSRRVESQNLLVPETFDLTPAQAAAFDEVSEELERLGFSLMRLSGRTVAVRAVPAELPAGEARNLLAEILDAVDTEKRGRANESLRERVAVTLACRAAVKVNTPLTEEKMRWLISRLLQTSSPTTCPHGRPVILRLNTRDIERSFNRP
ncbi:MAG TPA: DNA mismatch repair endonuclease MutL [Pyrinomonadaceae bacterium]|jgi:DNA mismatch repair protein MutL|nr:DNA mismatch repair endonuclease MutL [Pyrinomonadaceae bacterium]